MTRTSQMFQCAQQPTSPFPSSILGSDVFHLTGDICFPMAFEQKSRLSYRLRNPLAHHHHMHKLGGELEDSSLRLKTRKTTCLASLPEVCGHGWPSRGGQSLVGNLALLLKLPRACGLWWAQSQVNPKQAFQGESCGLPSGWYISICLM